MYFRAFVVALLLATGVFSIAHSLRSTVPADGTSPMPICRHKGCF